MSAAAPAAPPPQYSPAAAGSPVGAAAQSLLGVGTNNLFTGAPGQPLTSGQQLYNAAHTVGYHPGESGSFNDQGDENRTDTGWYTISPQAPAAPAAAAPAAPSAAAQALTPAAPANPTTGAQPQPANGINPALIKPSPLWADDDEGMFANIWGNT